MYFINLLSSGRREMSSYLVNNVIENTTCIPTSERVDTILTIVATLVTDQGGKSMRLDGRELGYESGSLFS